VTPRKKKRNVPWEQLPKGEERKTLEIPKKRRKSARRGLREKKKKKKVTPPGVQGKGKFVGQGENKTTTPGRRGREERKIVEVFLKKKKTLPRDVTSGGKGLFVRLYEKRKQDEK